MKTCLKCGMKIEFENGNIINLDLHEKRHGPHGLVAGTTGSGKSTTVYSFLKKLNM